MGNAETMGHNITMSTHKHTNPVNNVVGLSQQTMQPRQKASDGKMLQG